jgi:hypothetical protein
MARFNRFNLSKLSLDRKSMSCKFSTLQIAEHYQQVSVQDYMRFILLEVSVRPKQEFWLSAENEYSAAKNHRIFGFGRIFGSFHDFRPKVTGLLQKLTTQIVDPNFNYFSRQI